MSSFQKRFSGKRLSVAVYALLLVFGLGFLFTQPALAREDDRFVSIGRDNYFVHHDGNGPYISFNGNRYYLEGRDSDRFVVVNGRRYEVRGDKHGDHRHRRDHHERNRHHHDRD